MNDDAVQSIPKWCEALRPARVPVKHEIGVFYADGGFNFVLLQDWLN